MLQINYNQFTNSELERIYDCARALNFIFGQQFPGHKRQMQLLQEDEQFRAINQIVIQSHNTLAQRIERENAKATPHEIIRILDE